MTKNEKGKYQIDLSGSDGNTFVLLDIAQKLSKELGHTDEKIEEIQKQMKHDNHKNLLDVFSDNYGDFVDVYY
tara:strand:- start:2108 stop:2326 length:219 start_codon:yes stop_codon:yes gene_type:complete